MPESARWLISQGRTEEANNVLQRVARANKRHLPDKWYEELDQAKAPDRKYNFIDLFRYPNIRRRALIAFYCWPVVSMVYYGLGMNPSFLGGDRYITFILAGIAEIPGVVFAGIMVNRLGRKILIFAGYLIAGAMLIITLFIPEGSPKVMSGFVILAKMFITMVYACQYVYSPELFPTVIRNLGMGLCSMFARIGGVSASYIIMYLVFYSKTAVVLIFAIASFIAAALTLLQPETSGMQMLETIPEAEAFGRGAKILSFKTPELKALSEQEVALQDMSSESKPV